MTTTIKVDRRDFNGSPIFINGDPIRLPLDTEFEAEDALLEVLQRSKIKYTIVPGVLERQVNYQLGKIGRLPADYVLQTSTSALALIPGLRSIGLIVDDPSFDPAPAPAPTPTPTPTPTPGDGVQYIPEAGYELGALQSASYAQQPLGVVSGLPLGYTLQLSVGYGLFYLDNLTLRLSGSVNYNATTSYLVHIGVLNASGVEVDGFDVQFNVIIGAISSPRWITIDGAGDKTGTSYANAAPLINISSTILLAGPDGTVNVVGTGADSDFVDAYIPVTAGAASGTRTLIQTTDASGNYVKGAVVFVGTRRLANGSKWALPVDPEEITYLDGNTVGNTIFRISGLNTHRLTFRGFAFKHVNYAFVLRPDTNKSLDSITVEDAEGFDTCRLVEHSQTSTTINNFTLKKSNSVGFSRAIFRSSQAATNILIEDVSGNSARQVGDSPGSSQAFCEIIDVTGAAINTIIRGTVTDRNAPGFMHLQNAHADYRTDRYMNGDGITFNGTAIGVLVENVLITGCVDGGIDSKAKEAIYRNVWCEDNKRSFRLWIETTVGAAKPWFTVENCHSINPTVKRNPPSAPDTVALHYGISGFRPDALFKGLNTAVHNPALPGCAGAIGIRTEANEPILRFAPDSFSMNGELMNSEADFAAYSGDGEAYSKLPSDDPIFYWELDLSNAVKAVVPTDQRAVTLVENSDFSRQLTADRPFVARLAAATQYGTVNRTGLISANAFNLDYEVLNGQPATMLVDIISPERNVDQWLFTFNITDDGVVAEDGLKLWVAGAARGTSDGSTFANAAKYTSIPAFINRMIAEDVAGEILIDATGGTINHGSSAPVLVSKMPKTISKRIWIHGALADGTPAEVTFFSNRQDVANGNSSPEGANWLKFGGYADTDMGFLEFSHLYFRHFGNGIFLLGRRTNGVKVHHARFYNCYRAVENSYENGTLEVGTARPSYLTFEDCELIKCERSFFRLQYGANNIVARRITTDGASRYGDSFMAMFVLQSQRNKNNAPSGESDPALRDEWHDVLLEDITVRNVLEAWNTTYNNGDGIDATYGYEKSATAPRGLVIRRYYAENCSDAGLDHKSIGIIAEDVHIKACKRMLKDWNLGGYDEPSTYTRLTLEEPAKAPEVIGSNDTMFHIGVVYQNQRMILNDPRVRNRTSLCNTFVSYSPGMTGGRIEIDTWDKFNVKDNFNFMTRDGNPATALDTDCKIFWGTPLPTSDFTITWKAGFEGGAIPVSTAVGTAVADITFPTTGGSTRSLRIVSGSTAFTIDQATKQIKVAQALNYATAPYHDFTIRGVYGIVGTNPITGLAGDPADDLTWQCYLGNQFVDKQVVCAVTGSGENAATTAFFTNNSLTAPSTAWRAAVDMFQNSIDAAGLRTGKVDIIPLNFAWSGAVAVLDALGNVQHNGAIEGTIDYDPLLGMFQSPGTSTADRVVWANYNPAAGGKTMTQNYAAANIEMATNIASANNFLFAVGYELFTGRINSTQVRYSIMTSNTQSFTSSASAAAWWTIRRSASNASDAGRNFAVVNSRTTASQAIGSGVTMCKTNPNKGALRSIGGYLLYSESAALKDCFDRLKTMAAQLA